MRTAHPRRQLRVGLPFPLLSPLELPRLPALALQLLAPPLAKQRALRRQPLHTLRQLPLPLFALVQLRVARRELLCRLGLVLSLRREDGGVRPEGEAESQRSCALRLSLSPGHGAAAARRRCSADTQV